ncbi:hemiasterlin resistant protein 1-like [Forsythia ovata]|uniref:Hemiasterlin resistant protein 1-like n=1 Tax=Forsythia ovata TaxID=205694 RepID=A0ABD1TQ67_9LAMI
MVAVNHAPPPVPAQASSGGSMLGNIGSTIAQGMAFGTGNAVAHRAVDAVMGPRTIQHETVGSEAATAPTHSTNSMGGSDACSVHSKAFLDVNIKLLTKLDDTKWGFVNLCCHLMGNGIGNQFWLILGLSVRKYYNYGEQENHEK